MRFSSLGTASRFLRRFALSSLHSHIHQRLAPGILALGQGGENEVTEGNVQTPVLGNHNACSHSQGRAQSLARQSLGPELDGGIQTQQAWRKRMDLFHKPQSSVLVAFESGGPQQLSGSGRGGEGRPYSYHLLQQPGGPKSRETTLRRNACCRDEYPICFCSTQQLPKAHNERGSSSPLGLVQQIRGKAKPQPAARGIASSAMPNGAGFPCPSALVSSLWVWHHLATLRMYIFCNIWLQYLCNIL